MDQGKDLLCTIANEYDVQFRVSESMQDILL